jgi:hypothetical protein
VSWNESGEKLPDGHYRLYHQSDEQQEDGSLEWVFEGVPVKTFDYIWINEWTGEELRRDEFPEASDYRTTGESTAEREPAELAKAGFVRATARDIRLYLRSISAPCAHVLENYAA